MKSTKTKIGYISELQKFCKKSDIKIPKGWRLLQFWEFSYLAENHPELNVGKNYEWGKIKNNVVSLGSYWDFDSGRLDVVGSYWGDHYGGAFGVRFIKDLEGERMQKACAEMIEKDIDLFRDATDILKILKAQGVGTWDMEKLFEQRSIELSQLNSLQGQETNAEKSDRLAPEDKKGENIK